MKVIQCDNLDQAIDEYKSLGYRLDMIKPADEPREALLSMDGEMLRLKAEPSALAGGFPALDVGKNPPANADGSAFVADDKNPPAYADGSAFDNNPLAYADGTDIDETWIVGRAGMEYRDLIPGRIDGKVIVSHIRLKEGGEVPDYVHYHKIEFQMIYCKRGRIKVVYEDQGPPFWLETGDCVLQPPEIRHRVLECTAGAEVIEVSMPAEHETWVEHNIELPTDEINPDRDFGGQRFVRHIAKSADRAIDEIGNASERDTGISAATNDLASVYITNGANLGEISNAADDENMFRFSFDLGNDEYLNVSIMK